MSATAHSRQPSGHGKGGGGSDRPAERLGGGSGILSSSRRPREPHEVLGVARNATPAQIRSAYRRLALLHHPDRIRNPDDAAKVAACARFAEIGAAYEILTADATSGGPGQEQQEERVQQQQQHNADAAAGGPPPPAARPPSARRPARPFQYDPFFVFDDFFGTGERWPREGGGNGHRRPPPPFGGFPFTDPFHLFGEMFGPGFVPGGEEDDSDGDDEDDPLWPGGVLADPRFVGVSGGSAFGVPLDGSLNHPVHPTLIGLSMPSQPPNQQGSSVAVDAHRSFVSAAASVCNVPCANGRSVAMSTSTSIINGHLVTKTVCETLNPDGSRNTTIDVTGDGVIEEEMLQRRPDLLDDIVVNARVPAPPPSWAVSHATGTTQHCKSGSQANQDGRSSSGTQQEIQTTNLLGLDPGNSASVPSVPHIRVAPFERGDPGSPPESKKERRPSLGVSPDGTSSIIGEGTQKRRKYE